ncbi:hypothetical protein SAMN04488002_0766 [Litoreibacter janthinus]|uniref:HNH endonuclease n=1 Tax=Litoreibacter janthinus TaxID=670154 RepID=A0A1I6G233_9RHOB|nr:hypothetical protein SAMN04488002_0766 [Litoreibacter janthinus]
MAQEHPTCPLCRRPIPPDAKQSLHHLIPKLKGGKGGPVALLHQICHNEIHATLSEADLARSYNTPDALRAHPRLKKFVDWVANDRPTFIQRHPALGPEHASSGRASQHSFDGRGMLWRG